MSMPYLSNVKLEFAWGRGWGSGIFRTNTLKTDSASSDLNSFQ